MNIDFLRVVLHFVDYFIFYIFVYFLLKKYFIPYIKDFFNDRKNAIEALFQKKIELSDELENSKIIFYDEKKTIFYILSDFEKWQIAKQQEKLLEKIKIEKLNKLNLNKRKISILNKGKIDEFNYFIKVFNNEMASYGNKTSDEFIIETFFLERKKDVL